MQTLIERTSPVAIAFFLVFVALTLVAILLKNPTPIFPNNSILDSGKAEPDISEGH